MKSAGWSGVRNAGTSPTSAVQASLASERLPGLHVIYGKAIMNSPTVSGRLVRRVIACIKSQDARRTGGVRDLG